MAAAFGGEFNSSPGDRWGSMPADSCQESDTFTTIAWQILTGRCSQSSTEEVAQAESHMLMIAPIIYESSAAEGVRFILPLFLGKHQRTESIHANIRGSWLGSLHYARHKPALKCKVLVHLSLHTRVRELSGKRMLGTKADLQATETFFLLMQLLYCASVWDGKCAVEEWLSR